MKTIEWKDEVDRAGWDAGPWDGEPDRVQWLTAAGLPGLAVRHDVYGHWCGYVAVPPGHRYHGHDWDDTGDLEVHGGLTYADKCHGKICHEVEPGDADDVWWLGFDCAHLGDLSPGTSAILSAYSINRLGFYKDLDFVKREVEALARQLVEAP